MAKTHAHIHKWDNYGYCEVKECNVHQSDTTWREAVTGEKTDIETLAEGVDDMREAVRALVAGLVNDGFSDSQARDIVAGLWRMAGREVPDGDED